MSFESTLIQLNSSRISDWIFKLHQQSLLLPRHQFKHWCFTHLLNVIQYDSGIWLSRSDLSERENSFLENDTSLHNQPFSFMQAYAEIADRPDNVDYLEQAIHEKPGHFFSLWDVCSKEIWHQTEFYQRHGKKYHVENALAAIMLPSKYSSVQHILGLYRSNPNKDFSSKDKHTVTALLPHLIEAFSANLLASFNHQNKAEVRGVVDRYGQIVLAEESFEQYMEDKGLLEDNRLTIEELALLTEPMTLNIEGGKLDLSFHEGLIYIEVYEKPLQNLLSRRQMEICQLISKGLSNKEIAALLDLQVYTINNHVKQAFKTLRVKSRAAATAYLVRKEVNER